MIWRTIALQRRKRHHDLVNKNNGQWSISDSAKQMGISRSTLYTDLRLLKYYKEVPHIFRNCKTKSEALYELYKYQSEQLVRDVREIIDGYNSRQAENKWK